MCMCKKCMLLCGLILLILGILFLLVDLKVWSFWGIQWWSALFVVFGVGLIASTKCPDCQSVRVEKKK